MTEGNDITRKTESRTTKRCCRRIVKPSSRWLAAPNSANDGPPRHPLRSTDSSNVRGASRSPQRKPISERKRKKKRQRSPKKSRSPKKITAVDDNYCWWGSGLNKSAKYKELEAKLDELKENQKQGDSSVASRKKTIRTMTASLDNDRTERKPSKSPKKPASKKKIAKKKRNECKFDTYTEDILSGSYHGTIDCQDMGNECKFDEYMRDILSGSYHGTIECQDMGIRYKVVSKANLFVPRAA